MKIRKLLLYITVFITGAVILSIEILGTRIIAPYYGNTIYVWSSLIGVTLFALAAGYFAGGVASDRFMGHKYMNYAILAAAIFILVIPFIKGAVLQMTDAFGPRYGALFAAALLFFPTLFCMGMVAPYSVKLGTEGLDNIGKTAGSLYAVSTAGSFVGAIMTGFYMIPLMGIKNIIMLLGLLLIILAVTGLISAGVDKKHIAASVLIAFFLLFIPESGSGLAQCGLDLVYEKETPYSRLRVVDTTNGFRYMLTDGIVQGCMNKNDTTINDYAGGLLERTAKLRPSPQKMLIIGLGTGRLDDIFRKRGMETLNIEIDPDVADVAKRYFGFTGHVDVMDGRIFLKHNKNKYDITIFDAYKGAFICHYLVTKEAFSEMKDSLKPGGILSLNVLGITERPPGETDPLTLSIYATLKSVFKNVEAASEKYGVIDIVFYCSDEAMQIDADEKTIKLNLPDTGIVMTDDYNPVEIMGTVFAERMREAWRQFFGKEYIL